MEEPPGNISTPQTDIFQTPERRTVPNNPDYRGDLFESINEDDTKLMISTLLSRALGI
jgi:hypothetical protein